MSIHEHLPPQARKQLKQLGWAKGLEPGQASQKGPTALRFCNLVGQNPPAAERGIRTGGRKGLTGRETEPWETIYFKLYQSQMPVIERAIETAPMMLESDAPPTFAWKRSVRTSWPGPTWTAVIRRLCLTR
jgi:hypothetical protein